MEDYYLILGVNENSILEEIKKAYRKLSLKYHPDRNGGDKSCEEQFKKINEAYHILSDTSKRNLYNEKRRQYFSNKSSRKNPITMPSIIYFRCNRRSFVYDDIIVLSWHVAKANKVTLTHFGVVRPTGTKRFRVRDFKNEKAVFTIIAENTNTRSSIESTIELVNQTYKDLYQYFKSVIDKENLTKR